MFLERMVHGLEQGVVNLGRHLCRPDAGTQLREDMLVVSNTVLRLDRNRDYHDGTLHDILREMQAVHRQIASIASRVRKLEGVE